MATLSLTIEVSDATKQYLESRVGPGKFKDVGAYAAWLITSDMESQRMDFTPEEKARVETMLLEALDQVERGECSPWQPGEGRKILDKVIEQHRQAGQP